MARSGLLRICLPFLAVMFAAMAAEAHVRIIVRDTNWFYTRHECYIGVPWKEMAGGTGMGRGVTELRVDEGDVTFAHRDIYGIWPPIAYHCPARFPSYVRDIWREQGQDAFLEKTMPMRKQFPEVALDLTLAWVYVGDGLVWTPGGRTFAQTFIAEGPEMVSVGCQVASSDKPVEVSLHKGTPDGERVGGTKQFASASGWGFVYWQPGEAPTVPGEKYCVLLRTTGESPWVPYAHSRGNCYDGGNAFVDGVPYPETDLSLLISNPGDGYVRHRPIMNDARNEAEWSDVPHGQRFVARGRNLIFASVDLVEGGMPDRYKHEPKGEDRPAMYLVVRKGGPEGERFGQRLMFYHLPMYERTRAETRGIPFHPDGVPLEPGQTYFAGIEFEDGAPPPADWKVRMRLYGEDARGSHPTVATVQTGRIFTDKIEIFWRKGNPSKSVIEYGKPGGSVLGTVEEMETAGEGLAALHGLEADTVYQFRLIASSPQGYKYCSPWYLARTRAEDGTLEPVDSVQDFGSMHPYFQPIAFAPLRHLKPHEAAQGKPVTMANPGFESGMNGWEATDGLTASTADANAKASPHGGSKMAGYSRKQKGSSPNHDLVAMDSFTQTVKVTPGKWYQLSARVMTLEPEWTREQYMEGSWSFPLHGARGQNRIALVADPKGGKEFEGTNRTQWFTTTDGTWILVSKDFEAESVEVTVGASFMQRGERVWDIACVDDFRLVELGKPR